MAGFMWTDGEIKGRQSWLLFVKEKKIYKFEGQSIADVCAIKRIIPYRGKKQWYSTDYIIRRYRGVYKLYGWDDWYSFLFIDGLRNTLKLKRDLRTVDELADALGSTQEETRRFMGAWRPEELALLS